MEQGKIMLLLQLANKMSDSYKGFSKAYDSSDKENFELFKSAILEIQKKIDIILSNP